jgi:hypothetical protein
MRQVAAENNFKDIALIEKTIRAFSLLESLERDWQVDSNINFVQHFTLHCQ